MSTSLENQAANVKNFFRQATGQTGGQVTAAPAISSSKPASSKAAKNLSPAVNPKYPLGPYVPAGQGQGDRGVDKKFTPDSTNRNLPEEINRKIEGQMGPQLVNYIKNSLATRLTTIDGHKLIAGGVPSSQASGVPFSGKSFIYERRGYNSNSILGENVLNSYVNYTYNFTLSGLFFKDLSDPEEFNNASEQLKILSSSGKGPDYKIGHQIQIQESFNRLTQAVTRTQVSASTIAPNPKIPKDITVGTVNEFNKNSPGRFDMYIDNVEIETLMGYSGKSGPTLPTSIRFEVFEPYSMSGFMEALNATALASGYVNYATASYLLKLNFTGYTDTDYTATKSIPNSTRFFAIYITEVQIEVTEKGTRYICVALPYNEFSFTDSVNKLRQNVQAAGVRVDDILQDFIRNVQFQRAVENNSIYVGGASPGADTYKIVINGDLETLSKSNLADPGDEKNVEMLDPQYSTKSGYGQIRDTGAPQQVNALTNAKNIVVNFSAQQNITDCIAAVISESAWARNLMKRLYSNPLAVIDEAGFLDYFSIRVVTENKSATMAIDPITNRYYQTHTYLIEPYKIHYTLIPGFQQDKFNYSTHIKDKLSKLIFRDYNYIYTGKNTDILDFKINFKNSYLAPLSPFTGGTDKNAIKSIGKTEINGSNINTTIINGSLSSRQHGISVPSSAPNSNLNSQYDTQRKYYSVTANQPLGDPFYLPAKTMYAAITNNPGDMVEVELVIIGDPLYVATNGIGNFDYISTNGLIKEGGMINQYNGIALIRIRFQNPEDIDENGLMKFSPRFQFSGIYMVRQIVSKFSNGVFTQILKLNRMSQTDESTTISPIVTKTIE